MWVVWRRGDGAKSVFFFQAEDGIRDRDVTGVQTCALPIYRSDHQPFADRILAGPEAPRRGLANDHNRGFRLGLLHSEATAPDDSNAKSLEIIRQHIAVARCGPFVLARVIDWRLLRGGPDGCKSVAA